MSLHQLLSRAGPDPGLQEGMQLALRLGEGTGGKALEYTAHLSRCCCSSGTLQGDDVASFLCAEFLTWVLGKDAEDN